MRKTSFFLLVSACAALAEESGRQPRPGQVLSFGFGGANNIEILIDVVVEPRGAGLPTQINSGSIASAREGNGAYRYTIDEVHRQYFGYDISAEQTSVAGEYRVTISPLTWTPTKEQGPLSPVFLPRYPAPQIMRESDTLELVLLSSADGKQQVVDYIQVRYKPVKERPEPPATTSKELAKDYTPDDGPVEFNFGYSTIWIGGDKYSGGFGADFKPGATLWFYYPGEGRYVLSLVPHDGFKKAGEIRDNVIAFEAFGRQIEIRTMKSMIGDSPGAWNLYALHDPAFQPKHADSVQFGMDRLENLLPKR
jgi:hypothetical protein